MAPRKLTGIAIAFGAAIGALAACSDHMPSAPAGTPYEPDRQGPMARAVLGVYELTFLGGGQEVSTLPVCTATACPELALKATVQALDGAPAQSGMVTFQYCSLKGVPPNDIERADEAPKEACETGDANWASLGSVRVILVDGAPQFPPLSFGSVQIPRTVGFRFKYSSQGSGIAGAASDPENFTWTSP